MIVKDCSFRIGSEFAIPELPGVYIIYEHTTKQTLYIGRSINLRTRFIKHLSKSHNRKLKPFISQTPQELRFKYLLAISKMELVNMEEKYIRNMNPLFNEIKYRNSKEQL